MNHSSFAVVLTALLPTAAFADVFVPEGDAGTLLRLNSEYETVARVDGLNNVHGMSAAPKRGYLVLGSLSETDRADIARPTVVSEDEHAAHHGGGGTDMSGSVSVVTILDEASSEVLKQIEVPGVVHHVEVSADERWAVVTHPALEAISIIDLEKAEVSATIETGSNPEYAISDPTTGRFFVSNAGSGTISDVDPESGVVVRTFKVDGDPRHMRLLADARKLVVAEADEGVVSILDADSGDSLKTLDIGGELHGIAAMGDMVFVSARERGQIVRIDTATGATIEKAQGEQPYHMTLAGSDLLVSSAEDPVLWVLDSTTLELKKTIATAATAHQMFVTEGF